MSTRAAARVDGERLWSSLMAMAEIGATPAGGSNRPALSDADAAGRDLFTSWVEELGCEVHLDEVGNLFARHPGRSDGPVVLVGSHLDTQPTGGRFDGVYGVLGGLEVLRSMRDLGLVPERPVELVVWTNEEGSRFPQSMLGSAVWAGVTPLEQALALADADGVTVGTALNRLGLEPTRPAAPFPVHAAFELHIEQGPVLEAEGLDIGVVTGVLGFRWFQLELLGTPAHAGPTPMARRRDPARAVARVVDRVYELVDGLGPSARATFAQFSSLPSSPNTVPATLGCTLDLRHAELTALDALEAAVRGLIAEVALDTGVTATLDLVNDSPPVVFDPRCVDRVRAAAEALGLSSMDIVSGAGHDSCHVATVAPTSMIFVPCEGGLSHNEAESISPEQAERGASVLLGAVLSAAGE